MATFKDVQAAFKKGETSAYLCIATRYNVACETKLTDGQKEKLERLFGEVEHGLNVDKLRMIIFEVLCQDHQRKSSSYYEEQVETRWSEASPIIKQLLENDPRKRSPRRKSDLSNPSTPARQRSPSSSPLSARPVTLLSDLGRQSPLHGVHSGSNLGEDSVITSIEPCSPEPTTPLRNEHDFEDVSQTGSPSASNELLEVEGVDLVQGLIDHRWGDRSAMVSGERSERRQYSVYFDANGKLQKDPKQEVTVEDRLDESKDSTAFDGNNPFLEHSSRPILTPKSRKKSYKYEKSRTRSIGSRSPSTPPVSERAKQAYATMAGDAMYDRKPRDNESNVVELIHRPVDYNDKYKDGWIYAIRDPELDLVKIGLTTQKPPKDAFPGDQRFRNFRCECKLSSVAVRIKDEDQVSVYLFRRLEELVHEDLRPHRWYFDCDCGLKKSRHKPTEHHEWYDVPNEIALNTIKLWRDFILLNPYGQQPQNGERHRLEANWLQILNDRAPVASNEEHSHHDQRIQRWKALLRLYTQHGADTNPVEASDLHKRESEAADFGQIKLEEEDASSSLLHNIPPAPDEQPTAPPLSDTKGFDILLNDDYHSFPTTPGSPTPAGTRSSSRDDRGRNTESTKSPAGLPLVLADDDSKSRSKSFVSRTDLTEHKEPKGVETYDFAAETFKLADLLGSLDALLRKQRAGLPSRSAYEDMYNFRWPFSTAVVLAMCSSYLPPHLSASFWLLFLPFFVAELREWHHADGVQK